MKILELDVQNFKVFKNETFKFKKITLLTGANSAGKSTVLNALVSITQNSGNSAFPFEYNANGDLVNLGSYKELVTDGNSSERIKLKLTYQTGKNKVGLSGQFRYASSGNQILLDRAEVSSFYGDLKVDWKGQEHGYKALRKYSGRVKNLQSDVQEIIASMAAKISSSELKKINSDDLIKQLDLITQDSNDWESLQYKTSKDIYKGLSEDIRYKNLVRKYKDTFTELSKETGYIGPIRPHPSNQYMNTSSERKIDPMGLNTYQWLMDWYNNSSPKFKKVIEDLQSIGLADDLGAKAVGESYMQFLVTPPGHSKGRSINDVGFGVSQLLPIVVANNLQKKDSTFLVNQPEVHLHPSSQAKLANYFTKESSHHNLIIETHSEYMINRFRLLVAKGELKPEDISIIYISHNDDESKVSPIEITKNGALSGAPESFFDTYYVDNKDLVFASFMDDEE
ncbi:conserved hypothetical protein [Vibrio coralliirubri]|uniref:DUF3696 domain-containing protein n=1 Tax=Vibrio coralliirubri TaxID=1516159 RepID=UPI0006307373|nr:DUF3696 domain-containing protein [Vibrio coralliirubri]CDT85694.1 conserved hypothetical protein [Vibrio coralliirubri]